MSDKRKTTRKSTLDLLNDLRGKLGSWEKVGKSLGVTSRSIRRWRQGTRNPDKGKWKGIIRDTAKKKRIRLTKPKVKPLPTPPSQKPPFVDSNLTKPSYYFEMGDYPTWILRSSKDVWFVSNLIPDNLPDIQGGTLVEYQDYFAPFVNYVNGMASMTEPESKDYEDDWFVSCTEPEWNEENGRWESEIISIDADGNIMDYGFDPLSPYKLAEKVITTERKPPVEEKPTEVPPTEPEAPKEEKPSADAERVKEIRGLIADLRQDVKDGLLSKEDYSKLVKDLTSKLEKGGSI